MKLQTTPWRPAMQSELLPCPFCGSKDPVQFDQTGISWIMCEGCGAEGPTREELDGAIASWNRRAPVGKESE